LCAGNDDGWATLLHPTTFTALHDTHIRQRSLSLFRVQYLCQLAAPVESTAALNKPLKNFSTLPMWTLNGLIGVFFNKITIFKIIYYYFIFYKLLCCHTGYHPQGNLATFGYGTAMKVEIY
jgi:hypothetical protein